MKSETPVVLLVGGLSTRMGKPKHLLIYQGQLAWKRIFDLATTLSNHVYISCREEQTGYFGGCSIIIDTYQDIGPMGAILTTFDHINDDQIVFISCDTPHLKPDSLALLLNNEVGKGLAACLQSEKSDFPEPILAKWKRNAQDVLKNSYRIGRYSLTKCLIKHGYTSINVDPLQVQNVNTQLDYYQAIERIKKGEK